MKGEDSGGGSLYKYPHGFHRREHDGGGSNSRKGLAWSRKGLAWSRKGVLGMDQLEELRGCDERLTAGMLDRLGDLRR